jgi:hypothetical protein
MKFITTMLAVLLLVGCATSSTQYYEAVQKTAEANAKAAQAKFDALSAIAAAGDGQAASAAVMALALTQTPSVTPIPQQSEAMQWASILASPVTSLGMMWMQADSSKTMARMNARVDLASIKADAETQQALYGSFSDISSSGFDAVSNVDYGQFIDGMVTLGVTGMDGIVDMGTAGFDANTAIAVAGITQVGATAEDGLNSTANVGIAGMTNLVTLGTNGLDAAETLGIQGMLGIHETNEDWLSYLNKNDLIMQDMLKANGCVITTDSNNKIVVTCN